MNAETRLSLAVAAGFEAAHYLQVVGRPAALLWRGGTDAVDCGSLQAADLGASGGALP